MANKLSAQIDLLWKGSRAASNIDKDFDKVEKSVEGADDAIQKATSSTKEFNRTGTRTESGLGDLAKGFAAAGVAIAAVGFAAREAYEVIGEGAALQAAEGKFDNLAASINTTGDAMLGKLTTATKGMVTEAELVAGATTIMDLGLAKTEAGTVRMAAAVGALNLDLGVMALTLANDSTARLDSLGLSMENVARTKQELLDSGFIGDAFDEAVLIELEKKMTLLGDASETTAGQMKIIETAAANLTNEFKIMAAQAAGPLISALSENISVTEEWANAVEKGIISQEMYNYWHARAADIYDKESEAYAYLTKATQEHTQEVDRANEAADEYLYYQQALYGALDDTATGSGDASIAIERYARGIQDAIIPTQEFKEKTGQSADELRLLEEEADAVARLFEGSFSTALGNTSDAYYTNSVNADMLNENLFNQIDAMSDNAIVTASAALALGVYDEKQVQTALNAAIIEEEINNLSAAFVNGEINAAQLKEKMDEIVQNSPYTSEIDVLTEQAIGNIDKIKGKLDSIERHIKVRVTVEGSGVPSGAGATSGGGGVGRTDIPEFATGGTVPGPIGSPQLILAHGGEQVLTQSQARGGGGITQNFYSNTRESQALAWAQAEQLRRARMDAQ